MSTALISYLSTLSPQECLLANPLVIPQGLSQLSLTFGFPLLLVRNLVFFVPPHVHNSLLNTSHPNHSSQPGSYGTQGAVYNVILSAAWSSSTNVVAVGFVSTTSAGLILRSTNGGVSWSLLGVWQLKFFHCLNHGCISSAIIVLPYIWSCSPPSLVLRD